MPAEEWTTAQHVLRYLERADEYPRRGEGESVLLDHVPREPVASSTSGPAMAVCWPAAGHRPEMRAVGLDFSKLMLEAGARRFGDDGHVELIAMT